MKKKIKVKQHDITDCGAACLASVCSWYNLEIPVATIRQMASTDMKGTNVLGMIEASEKLKLSAKGVKGPFESLFTIPLPAIAHVIIKNVYHHYVVIYKMMKRYVIIMDPADGKIQKKTHDEFREVWSGALIILAPTEDFKTGNLKIHIWQKFYSLIRPHKSIMIQALFGAIVYSLLGLSTSIYMQKIVDYVLVDGNKNLLNLMSMCMIIIISMKLFVNIMKSIFALRTGQRIDAALILSYYKHLLKLPQRFFDTMRVGEIVSRVNDAVKIRTFINNASLDISVNLLIIFFTLGLMLIYSWKLALIVTLFIPVFICTYILINKLNKKYLRRIMENSAELESHLVESLNSISTIKHFGSEEFANMKTESRFIKLLRSSFVSIKNGILVSNSTELMSGVMTITILWIGSAQVIKQELTPGTLLSFYALTSYLINPVTKLIHFNQTIQDALIAADRLFQIMDIEAEESDKSNIKMTRDMINDISFKDISFRYGTRVQVFKELNLTIPKAKMTAIVGESGSGKTSLISIIQNIYPLQSGSVTIGDYNLDHICSKSLRKLICAVPQKIELFSGTILENIALGEYEPNMKRVVDITLTLGIKDFIEKLPNGYFTYVGEHGVSLSGGEKQRLAIARALYKDPEIIIFDEATSSLDSASESNVKKTIEVLKNEGKTIIVIAHRLSTIMEADKIVVLHEGKVIEEGDHYHLMDKKGVYFTMWKKQMPILEQLILPRSY